MVRHIEYKGHSISLTVLPEQGRWAYRIENGPMRAVNEARSATDQEVLFREAEARAKQEIDRGENLARLRERRGGRE